MPNFKELLLDPRTHSMELSIDMYDYFGGTYVYTGGTEMSTYTGKPVDRARVLTTIKFCTRNLLRGEYQSDGVLEELICDLVLQEGFQDLFFEKSVRGDIIASLGNVRFVGRTKAAQFPSLEESLKRIKRSTRSRV